MAMFPCSYDQLRYRGPSNAMYPAIVQGTSNDREHLRLCTTHFNQLESYCQQHFEAVVYDVPGNDAQELQQCSACRKSYLGGRMCFVTAYRSGAAEQQYWGRVCDSCDADVRTRLLLPVLYGGRAT